MNDISDYASKLGRLGGMKILEKRGRKYYSEMGKRSGEKRRKKSETQPVPIEEKKPSLLDRIFH